MKVNEIIPLLSLKPLPGDPLFKINTLEYKYGNGYPIEEPPHRHDHLELIWITNGTGICHMDLDQHDFCTNSVFCIKQGQVHQLVADNALTGFIISFDRTFLNADEHESDAVSAANLFHVFSAGHDLTLQSEIAAQMNVLALAMISEFRQCFPLRMQVLKRLLKIFFIYLLRQFETLCYATKQPREIELSGQFIYLLEKNYRELKMVSDYAKLLFITPNYLSEVVKKTSGIPAGQHIRQRIALEAKRMGHYSGSCMKEIASNLGFADSAHFSKFFKSASGMNFSDFKKEDSGILQMA